MPKLLNPSIQKWTEPQVYPKKPTPDDMSKEWRVRFRYYNEDTGRWEPVSRKSNINTFTSFKARLAEAKALRAAIRFKLEEEGWNPLTDTYDAPPAPAANIDEELERMKQISFNDALDFAYNKKLPDWRGKTPSDYKSVKKYLQLAAKKINLDKKEIASFKLAHYRLVLDTCTAMRTLSPKGFNKYREYLSSLVAELIQWEIVELNFVHHIKTKKVAKTRAHRPPSADERLLIVNRIRTAYRPYYRFLAVEYGCTLRPKEICALKIKHLHKIEQVFRLPAKDHKSNADREVAIPDWLMDLFAEMNLHKYNPEWYIFSAKCRQKGYKTASFMPGPTRMHSHTTTRWWRKIVKEDLKLDVNQYGLKKLSGDDMVRLQRREGVDKLLELPKQQMGHASEKMTAVYVNEHEEVLKEVIKRKMPML